MLLASLRLDRVCGTRLDPDQLIGAVFQFYVVRHALRFFIRHLRRDGRLLVVIDRSWIGRFCELFGLLVGIGDRFFVEMLQLLA